MNVQETEMCYNITECGMRSPSLHLPNTYIVDGTLAKAGEWPWMARMSFGAYHICGASILNQEWLLTAAHCVNS